MTAPCLPGTAARQNILEPQRHWWVTDFSVICRNTHFHYQQYQYQQPFSLSVHPWLRQKRNCGKGKAGYFFLGYRKGVEEVKQTEKGLRSQRTRNLNSKQLQQPSVAEGRKKKVLRNKGGLCWRKEHLASVRLTFLHRCWDVYSLLCCLWENISSLSPVLLCLYSCDLPQASASARTLLLIFSLMSRLWWIHCAPLTHTRTHAYTQENVQLNTSTLNDFFFWGGGATYYYPYPKLLQL